MLSQGQYSPLKVDVWSCGIVLYTMLCGFLPFEHENTLQLYKIVEQGNYDEPSHLSSNAKDILKKMLQPNPERRLTISQIRKHPFVSQYQEPLIRGLLPGEKIML
jgi:5'-AMP-activated protein kinase catalytic alpha subunit